MFTYTSAVLVLITTTDVRSLNVVVRKQPKVKAAKTVSVNANIVFARANTVFIFNIHKKTRKKINNK